MNITKDEKKQRAKLIVENFQGVLPQFEAFYIQYIFSKGFLCLQAFKKFENLCLQKDALEKHEEIFEALHTALSHCAAISRFFWPSRDGILKLHEERGKKLRDAFRISDESPIKHRKLRDAIEHFDEKLDEYLLSHEMETTIMLFVTDNMPASEDNAIILRHINIYNCEVSILGEVYSYGEITSEIFRITELAKKFSSQGYRLR